MNRAKRFGCGMDVDVPRERDQMIRAGTKVLTSRNTGSLIRGVFGTLFGGKR